ncbi:MAG: 2,3-diphosphoglycerate-dependent phosphoglycerate mutase [Candidatus Gracilibacteria bacterium]|jgi:2,3-bisphosphoglycerate-dependent phosphoglycerate mutase
MAKLILVRHGESEWNKNELWTGWADIGLSEKGREQARQVGEKLKGMKIDFAYTSVLLRAKQTLDGIKGALGINMPTFEDKALNEKNYGIYTGKNKWEVRKEVGEDLFLKIRRSWDYQIPEGESLKKVYERVVPYYDKEILPKIKAGSNIIIIASDNSLRALIKYLENINDSDIQKLELKVGEVDIFEIDNNGKVISKKNPLEM